MWTTEVQTWGLNSSRDCTQFCETLLLSKSNIAMQSPLPHTLPAPSNPPAHFISHSFISFSHSIHPFYSCTCFLLLFCSNTSILLFLYSETNVLVLVSIDMTLQNMKFLFILKWHFKWQCWFFLWFWRRPKWPWHKFLLFRARWAASVNKCWFV